MNKFDAHKRTVKEIFGYIYKIPFYQRGYSWKAEQVKEFWDDLMMVSDENQSEYFLGSLVLNEEDQTALQVIDGQQRLTTITIFLCSVRDLLILAGKREPASTIHHAYIAERDLRGVDKYRLTLSEDNLTFFQDYIQIPIDEPGRKHQEDFDRIPSNKRHPSNNLIWEAHLNFKKFLQEFIKENNGDGYDSILTLVEIVTRRFLMISITVNSDTDAYIIFETLNDRGMDLSTADLLKNHLFSRVPKNQIEVVQHAWTAMAHTLNQDNITSFLRYYWLAKYERVTDKKLYEKIKAHVNKAHVAVKDFVGQLSDTADIYMNIVNPTSSAWSDPELLRSLESINLLNYKAAYPVILIGRINLSETNLRVLSKACENFIFKFTTICGGSPSEVEKLFITITKEIRDSGDSGMENVLQILRKNQPDNEKFKHEFASKVVSTQKTQRYVLEKLNSAMGTGETIANNTQEVHVEHIMPKKLSTNWELDLELYDESPDNYVNRIGNLTLLSRRLNQSASNREFTEKRDNYYINSEFNITRDLLKYDVWNYSSIEQRQTELARIAVEIWGI